MITKYGENLLKLARIQQLNIIMSVVYVVKNMYYHRAGGIYRVSQKNSVEFRYPDYSQAA